MESLQEMILLEIFDSLDANELTIFSESNKFFNKLSKSYAVKNMNILQMYNVTFQKYKYFYKDIKIHNAESVICNLCKIIYADSYRSDENGNMMCLLCKEVGH